MKELRGSRKEEISYGDLFNLISNHVADGNVRMLGNFFENVEKLGTSWLKSLKKLLISNIDIDFNANVNNEIFSKCIKNCPVYQRYDKNSSPGGILRDNMTI